MDNVLDSKFVVYVRLDPSHAVPPNCMERPIFSSASYAEARSVQRKFRRSHQDCVIRFEGITGGGD